MNDVQLALVIGVFIGAVFEHWNHKREIDFVNRWFRR